MTTKRFGKKILTISSITLGILLVLLTGFHFWFKAHARQMIEDMVESKSNGKLKLKVDRFSFNWLTKKMEFQNAVFYSTDSAEVNTSYSFQIDLIKLKVQAILPIVFRKTILIDTMTLLDPEILVTRLKPADKKETRDVSIPEEMGKVYNSIQDALKVLKVSRFLIDNGKFTLINKIDPGQQPITISNLRFQVDNLRVDTTIKGAREKILFSDNVILQSHDQNIIFPDGRHRISFSQFRINLQKKLVEFDSCTIAATRDDSSSASFSIFLDALKLIDIDFDTLYKHEVIKADSVYCVNPTFNLEVELGKKKPGGKAPPSLESIIKQLTGDMQLGYVVVNNADFNVKTIRNGNPSSFTSTGNNFEMQGLTIDQRLAKPLKVKSFAMAIRNYENFLKDSTYTVQFDSILFREDRIYLSNFLFHKLDGKGRILHTFNIPQFYLGGLSWDDLVFEQKLKAEQATLFNPYISYSVSSRNRKKGERQDIFQSLSAVNDYMDLEYLDIIDGNIDLKVNQDVRIQLENATLAIQSHNLLTSTKLAAIKSSLTRMDFKKGTIRAGNLTLDLRDINYLGESGKFGAGQVIVRDKENKLAVNLKGVSVEKILVEEESGNIYSEDIKWQNGEISVNSGSKGSGGGSRLELRRVIGANTIFRGVFGDNVVSTKLDNISFASLDKKPGEKLNITGLHIDGKELLIKDKKSALSAGVYSVSDNNSSEFSQVSYKSYSGKLLADITIPSVTMVPHIQPLISGEIQLDAVVVYKPVISITAAGSSGGNKTILPGIDISEITFKEPKVYFRQARDSGMLSLDWRGNSSDYLQLSSLHVSDEPGIKTSVNKIKFWLTDLDLTLPTGKNFKTGNGKIIAELRNIGLEKNENKPWDWNGMVADLEATDLVFDGLGKNNGRLVVNSIGLSELGISSSSILSMQKLAMANIAFQVKKFNGSYDNAESQIHWLNASLNRNDYLFKLDSFTYRPKLDRDAFMATQTVQTDYLATRIGAIQMSAVDIDTYIRDNTLHARSLLIENASLTDYRDNRLPFRQGVKKNLPVIFLRKIPLQFSIDTIRFNNASVEYIQMGIKTKEPSTIPVDKMSLQLANVKNFNITATDSLDILASGYVLDSAWLRLRVKQSYTDPQGGFLMTARFKPVGLSVFNPVLVPLSSVKIQSGVLDTAFLRVTGFDSLAYGEMNMYYHDLKLRILKDGDETQKSFIKGLMTFFANTLVKNNNISRTSAVFQIRDQDRSAINYLVKIAMSGFASSVGVKNNKKKIRKHKKDLEKKQLPPAYFD